MRSMLHLVVASCLALAGCSSTPKRGDEVIESTEIKADSVEAQRRYEHALALLNAGEWASAEEEFRLIQTEFPQDPIAQVAELYGARAALRDFEMSDVGPPRALPFLSGLAHADDVDQRIRYAAAVYEAAALAAMGRNEDALAALRSYPGASLSPNVLKRDRPAAWSLIIEALHHADRREEAILACAEAYGDSSSNDQMRRFASARGFELAAGLDQDTLNDWSTDEDVFLRAIGGYTLVKAVGTGAPDELIDRTAAALAAIDAGARADEIATFRAPGPTRALRIGVLVPLSGTNRSIGERALRGAMTAELATPRGEITLVIEDSESQGALQRLDKAEVLAVVGPLDANRAKDAAPVARELRLPVVALATEIAATTDPWVFQDFVDANREAAAAAQVALSEGVQRVVILAPDIPYGQRMAAEFKRVLGGAATVVLETSYDRKATDYSKLAASVANAKPDAIYIPDTASKVAEVTAFLAAKNIWGRGLAASTGKDTRTRVLYLGTSLWQDDSLIRQAATYVEGAAIPAWYSPVFTSQNAQTFATRWASTGNPGKPTELEVFAYDAVSHLVDEIRRAPTLSRTAVRDGLLDAVPSQGIHAVTWSRSGKASRDLGFITVAGGFAPAAWKSLAVSIDQPAANE